MIQDARYTSPSGKETSFEWETGKRKTELKTGVYTFPGRDGAHVQHQGAGARSFPLVCIFSGSDCMEKADAFEKMLIERGVGESQHPTYGTIKAVPTGDIEREDDPVNKFGEASVTVTFTETIVDEETGNLTEVAADAIEASLDKYSEAAAADFAEALVTNDAATQLFIVSKLNTLVQNITDSLQSITSNGKKFADWLTAVRELKDSIKTLYQKSLSVIGKAENIYVKALNIGRLALHLMKLPSTLSVSLAEKIKGFSTLTANLINQYKNDPFGIDKMKAAYATASLAITGACAAIASGSALTIAEIAAMTGAVSANGSNIAAANNKANTPAADSTTNAASGGSVLTSKSAISGGIASNNAMAANINAGVASRKEAVEAALQIINIFEKTTDFQDTKITQLNIQNTGQTTFVKQDVFIDAAPVTHLTLSELVQLSVQLILNASFALPMQKTITLDSDRQVVELCAELYGSTDYLDN
jgi:prophage DNA circulation protein